MKHYLYITIIALACLQAMAQTSVSYTYDDLNRLTEVNYFNGVKVKYTYDALGNRMTRTVTKSSDQLRGDVDGDGIVNINDLSALIDYLLSGDASVVNLANADCDQSGGINIEDLSSLIDYLLTSHW